MDYTGLVMVPGLNLSLLVAFNIIFECKTHESKCLPTGSLPIHGYNSVIPVHGSAGMIARNGVIYGFVL